MFPVKKIVLFFLIFSSVKICFSQEKQQPVTILSPNAASLGIFGEIPVSYYTGTPDISIPLYELKYGSVDIPITLSYHPSLVKPNQHPGWVGLGWSLDAGGVITRKVNTNPDESKQTGATIKDNQGNVTLYGTYYYEGHKQLNNDSWATNIDVTDGSYERDPDEFDFNFLGYSGKFFYDHTGNWEVISDKPIKVEFSESDGLGGYNDITVPIGKSLRDAYNSISTVNDNWYISNENWNPFLTTSDGRGQCNCFIKFTLITDDGTRYEFGGVDATEFSIPYDSRDASTLVSNAWYLSKITYTSGKTVNFDYKRYFPTCSRYYYWNAVSVYTSDDTPPDWGSAGIKFGGDINFPVYLNKISIDNIEVDFSSSTSDELGYPLNFLIHKGLVIGTPSDVYGYNNPIYILNSDFDWTPTNTYLWASNLKWRKLDNLSVSVDNIKIRTINFLYSTQTGSPSKSIRLRLDKIVDADGQSGCGTDNVCGHYYFDYNQIESLPDYGGDYTDHWGYYNGISAFDKTIGTYSSAREPDGTKSILGLIKQITYPTGGYSTFTFGSNKYSQYVDITRDGLNPENGDAGGARIEQISTYENSTADPIVRNFYYIKNYDGTDPKNFSSSGILNGKPEYIQSFLYKKTLDNHSFSYESFSTVSCMAYGYNTQGSHIGYSEVIEKRTNSTNTINNGYSKYIYTNFDSHLYIDGVDHYDQPPLYKYNFDETTYKYCPFFESDLERGKITYEGDYDQNSSIIKEIKYQYRNDASRLNNYIRRIVYNSLDIAVPGLPYYEFPYIAAIGTYTYDYYLTSKTVTDHSKNETGPVSSTETYTYNVYNQISTISQDQSDGSNETTEYNYPIDYFRGGQRRECYYHDESVIYTMRDRNIIGMPIETFKKKGDNIISGEIIKFDVFPYSENCGSITSDNLILPSQKYNLEITTPIPSSSFSQSRAIGLSSFSMDSRYNSKIVYDNYDSYGNILQFHKINGPSTSYIWGYNNTLPIAKIANAPSNQVAYTSFEGGFPSDWVQSSGNILPYTGTNTGKNEISNGNIQSPSLPVGSYIVSFWAKGNLSYSYATVYINGNNSGINPDDNIGGRYQTTITLSAASRITIGFSYIELDEVRIYPVGALMTTYTYDPLVGMTSSTDEKNQTTYYVYDGFGRLWQVKNDKGNILKQYNYHYKNQ